MDKSVQQFILKRPSTSDIADAVGIFFMLQIKPDVRSHLSTPIAYKEFTIKWRPSFPSVDRKFGKQVFDDQNPHSAVVYLKDVCKFYLDSVPLKDKQDFLRFCFEQKKFNLRKFAIVLDEGYLAAALVDPNDDIRLLASVLVKYRA